MEKYKIKIDLLSDSIFGSGYSVPGSIDIESLYDKNGLPYMKGKTFKGNLREVAEELVDLLGEDYRESLVNLFGEENQGVENWKTLKISDCQLARPIRETINNRIKEGLISPEEVRESLTEVRASTSIDSETGSTKEGSLRTARLVKKGLTFELDLSLGREMTDKEKGLLAASVLGLRNIGGSRTRGKGQIQCRLFKDGVNIGQDYLSYLEKEVN